MLIAGVDEVGRGPLAGPVITAAVIFNQPLDGMMDSKKLTPIKRQKLALLIQQQALCYAYGRAEVEEIERLNIHQASLLAMKRAVEALAICPQQVLVDGGFIPELSIPCKAIIKGDSLISEISAASILAKVYRDAEMDKMDELYPGYGFAAHKGYPTKAHYAALLALGPSPIHRKTYAPVQKLLLGALV